MNFVSFRKDDATSCGVIDGDTIQQLSGSNDLTDLLPEIAAGRLPEIIASNRIAVADVELLPPIPTPGKVLCVATNFIDERPAKPVPDYPLVFTRFGESITGHGAPILKPAVSEMFDFEGEMAAIIGRSGHKIRREDAMMHVAGFACFNDGSVRDWQKHSSQFTPGKNFFRSAGFGPWMTGRDACPAFPDMRLQTRVNGIVKQEIALDRMIFDTAWLIAYISTFTPLAAGDVIVTGTPTGFGSTRNPEEFLSEGDIVEVEITGLGTLRNHVVQDRDERQDVFSQE